VINIVFDVLDADLRHFMKKENAKPPEERQFKDDKLKSVGKKMLYGNISYPTRHRLSHSEVINFGALFSLWRPCH
jgi:hypothetical protein